jgi:cytochrome c oxidase subunit 2
VQKMKMFGVLVASFTAVSMATCWVAFAKPAGAQPATNPADAPRVIEVSAKKYEFTPAEIHVKKGEKVELKIHSVDETHGVKLTVYPEGAKDKGAPGLVLDQPAENGKVTKGTDQIIDLTAQEPGTYNFVCAKFCGFGHDKMKGKLIVEP